MSTTDIWRTADLLLRAEGREADAVAHSLALAWTREGHPERACAWLNVARAITEFQRATLEHGESVN